MTAFERIPLEALNFTLDNPPIPIEEFVAQHPEGIRRKQSSPPTRRHLTTNQHAGGSVSRPIRKEMQS